MKRYKSIINEDKQKLEEESQFTKYLMTFAMKKDIEIYNDVLRLIKNINNSKKLTEEETELAFKSASLLLLQHAGTKAYQVANFASKVWEQQSKDALETPDELMKRLKGE